MSVLVEPTSAGGVRVTSGGVAVELPAAAVEQVLALRTSTSNAPPAESVVLPDDHPMWEHHSGGNRHDGTGWELPRDLEGAIRVRRHVDGKACGVFFEMGLSEPGRLFTSDEIVAAHPDVFSSVRAVAGCLAGFVKPTEELGRPFPFYWWEGVGGAPTRYAVRPSVASVFAAAGS